MSIILQEFGESFRWIDDLFVTPLSIARDKVNFGIWLSDNVLDVHQWLEKLQRVHCDGIRYWVYPPGGPRMLAVRCRIGHCVSYNGVSELSIQNVDRNRLTLRLNRCRPPRIETLIAVRGDDTPSCETRSSDWIAVPC
jgi:hypothetical protein